MIEYYLRKSLILGMISTMTAVLYMGYEYLLSKEEDPHGRLPGV